MKQPVYFSTRVLNTINSLPEEDRSAMAAALTSEFILGLDVISSLTTLQRMVYTMIRDLAIRDMHRQIPVDIRSVS